MPTLEINVASVNIKKVDLKVRAAAHGCGAAPHRPPKFGRQQIARDARAAMGAGSTRATQAV